MTRKFLLITFVAAAAFGASASEPQWTAVGPGVDYREYAGEHTDIFVTRVDLTNKSIQVVATPEPYRGTTVSEFAQKTRALAAINGDYFDPKFTPRGLLVSNCDRWPGARDNPMRQYFLAVDAEGRATIQPVHTFDPESTAVSTAVSGWPLLIKSCKAFSARELPGSDVFTRSPQPRTAVGVDKDGTTVYFVVADGRRTGVPGLTLAELAQFMTDELGACTGVNLDGGGSSAMWVSDRVVNRPADGVERRVGDHLAVVLKSDVACPPALPMTSSTTSTTTTTTTTTTVTTTTAPPR
jgi:exopolysaccharide biosynthesis protein